MSWSVLCSTVLLLIFAFPALAQDATPTPAPWPPDPTTIFAERVQWSVYEDESQPQDEPVQIDQDAGLIRVRDSDGTEHKFPFPEGIRWLHDAVLQSDGLIRVFLIDKYDRVDNILLLNPETGLYERPAITCNGERLQAEAGQGYWSVIQRDKEEYDEAYLCNTETGEEGRELPRTILEGTIYQWISYSTPDPDRLILSGYTLSDYQIFVYNLVTDQFIKLGVIGRGLDDDVYLCDWFTDTQGIFCSRGTHNGEGTGYYDFNIDNANSLKYVFGGWSSDTFRLEDPLRYISIDDDLYSNYMSGSKGEERPCTISVYDAAGLHQYELGDDCLLMPQEAVFGTISLYYEQNNSLYFLTTDDKNSAVAYVKQYEIDEDAIWIIGMPMEIESILSVSPDSHYFVVLVDDNGHLDFPWANCCTADTRGRQVMVMSEYGQVRYWSEPTGAFVPDQVMWADNSTLVLHTNEIYDAYPTSEETGMRIGQNGSLRRIHLEEDSVTVSFTTAYNSDVVVASPDGLHGLVYPNQPIDLKTFEPIPVVRPDTLEKYSISSEWQDDGRLKVEIHAENDYTQSITYLVTLP